MLFVIFAAVKPQWVLAVCWIGGAPIPFQVIISIDTDVINMFIQATRPPPKKQQKMATERGNDMSSSALWSAAAASQVSAEVKRVDAHLGALENGNEGGRNIKLPSCEFAGSCFVQIA
ncbi:hypothetical protein FF2_015264 [Malus domestica]